MPTFRFTKRVSKSAAGAMPGLKRLHITRAGGKSSPIPPAPETPPADAHEIPVGKTVRFRLAAGAPLLAGIIAKYANGEAVVKLAIPDETGLLMVSDAEVPVPVDALVACDAAHTDRKVLTWQTNEALVGDDTKGVAIKDQATGEVIDYKDVMFVGYGSTFANVTPRDRDGDVVMPGAFNETIAEFKRNPVMLFDHRNSVQNIAGSYTDIKQDEIGLRVVGKISNAKDETMRRIRALIMEGHLRTLSMGGIFLFGPDGHTIEKVYLFEISLVAIPANPDCIFQARALDIESATKMFRRRIDSTVKVA